MFELVKQGINLVELISKDLGVPFKQNGSENWSIEDEQEHGGCPFCGHKDCFKVRLVEGKEEEGFFKCFSCDERGDAIEWRAKRKEITPGEAAVELAKEFDIELPHNYSPVQEIFRLAATYYETCMWDTCNRPMLELGRMTPLQYQTEVRKHLSDTIKAWHVGWSDGGLYEYLSGIGFDDDLLLSSGLVAKRKDRKGREFINDYLPSQVFIYPHYVNGRVSHFTFKDPLKKLTFQLPKKFVLNGYMFYGQDTVKNVETIILCEGENDLLSLHETGKVPGVLATIGQISGEQLEWIKDNLGDKSIITMFDPDEAGDKYRTKVEKLRRYVKRLAHVRPPDNKDIDELLKGGADLESLIQNNVVRVTVSQENDKPKTVAAPWDNPNSDADQFRGKLADAGLGLPGEDGSTAAHTVPTTNGDGTTSSKSESEHYEITGLDVVQQDGIYYKVTWDKDDGPKYTPISDFTLRMNNVYIYEDGKRKREVVIRRANGFSSKPFMVSSDVKVQVKSFRTLIADQADATFKGTEKDLDCVWQLVEAQSTGSLVYMRRHVGRIEDLRGWLFRNVFISDTGAVTHPDNDGVFWPNGKAAGGIQAESLSQSNTGVEALSDIPYLDTSLTSDEKEQLMQEVVRVFAENRRDLGQALTLLGWMYANVHSNLVFKLIKGFPFLFVWGIHGRGKTTVIQWLQDFWGMSANGYTSVPQLYSGVGLGRKAEYYSSLPILIDEVRNNRETEEKMGVFRSYYDRTSRDMGIKESFGVRSLAVRSTFVFAGEDQFEDPATRQRCVPVRISPIENNRESYLWMQDKRHLFSGITYHWLLEATTEDTEAIRESILELDNELVKEGCSQRTSKVWASIGYFANKLALKYAPEFDYKAYMINETKNEEAKQKVDTTLSQFFELVEAIQAQENTKITTRHIMEADGQLHIWFQAVYKIVQDECRGRFPFSKNAVMSALKEEGYFVSNAKKITMGMDGARRVVVSLDLNKAPDSVKNIALTNRSD
jgi:5S rRNA maturation endonuclease (ribonuclease M5)